VTEQPLPTQTVACGVAPPAPSNSANASSRMNGAPRSRRHERVRPVQQNMQMCLSVVAPAVNAFRFPAMLPCRARHAIHGSPSRAPAPMHLAIPFRGLTRVVSIRANSIVSRSHPRKLSTKRAARLGADALGPPEVSSAYVNERHTRAAHPCKRNHPPGQLIIEDRREATPTSMHPMRCFGARAGFQV